MDGKLCIWVGGGKPRARLCVCGSIGLCGRGRCRAARCELRAGSLDGLEERDGPDAAKLGAAVQAGDLEDEEISDQVASQLLDESAGGSGGTTWKREIGALVKRNSV